MPISNGNLFETITFWWFCDYTAVCSGEKEQNEAHGLYNMLQRFPLIWYIFAVSLTPSNVMDWVNKGTDIDAKGV